MLEQAGGGGRLGAAALAGPGSSGKGHDTHRKAVGSNAGPALMWWHIDVVPVDCVSGRNTNLGMRFALGILSQFISPANPRPVKSHYLSTGDLVVTGLWCK